jgi:hypothetical protein
MAREVSTTTASGGGKKSEDIMMRKVSGESDRLCRWARNSMSALCRPNNELAAAQLEDIKRANHNIAKAEHQLCLDAFRQETTEALNHFARGRTISW